MYIPQDPEMLYSMINMKLRDSYDSFGSLCEDEDIDEQMVESILNKAGYFYNKEINQFR